MPSSPIVIASQPSNVFRALLRPDDLKAWWGCTVVTDARTGGLWVGGWGEGADGLGQGTVMYAEITALESDKRLVLKFGATEIEFRLEASPQGTAVHVQHPGAAAADDSDLQSWRDAITSMKAWVETAHPYTPPAASPAPATPQTPTPAAAGPSPTPTPSPSPSPSPQEEKGSDPYAVKGGNVNVTVVDEGGFGVTDPNAVVKSWSKEQGFGYATHAQLGDVVFDYDGCDFEPAPGDKVLLLVIGKRYDGKPKVKRIACPAKGSNIK